MHSNRLSQFGEKVKVCGAQAAVLVHLPNIRYLCGFTGTSGVLIFRGRGGTLFTDGRYAIQARKEVRGVAVQICTNGLQHSLVEALRRLGRATVAFEASQMTVGALSSLRRGTGKSVQWRATEGLVESLRRRKSAKEVVQLRRAAILISQVFEEVLPLVRPGVQEADLAAEIDYRMRRKGASRSAFETIVASGPRSALPHARPTAKRLRKNELVVMDMGAILGGYCSDLTRTVYLGRAPKRIRDWYASVVKAQLSGVAALRPGVRAEEVDAAARGTLDAVGLAGYFTHSTGHGLGLEIHEEPRLARGQKLRLQVGNVITIEPGIYVPGVGGIRIEDDVLVGRDGPEILTKPQKGLVEL